jgi:head-tail adaptor
MTTWPAHSRFLSELHDAFPSHCTIQAGAVTYSNEGDIVQTWADVVGMIAIHCRVSPVSAGREARTDSMTYSTTTHIITLAGRYAAIGSQHRAVVDGITYDIEAATGDGSGVMTRLAARIVTT